MATTPYGRGNYSSGGHLVLYLPIDRVYRGCLSWLDRPSEKSNRLSGICLLFSPIGGRSYRTSAAFGSAIPKGSSHHSSPYRGRDLAAPLGIIQKGCDRGQPFSTG